MSSGKLRVGILVDSADLLAWQRAMLRTLANSDYAQLVALVHYRSPPTRHDTSPRPTGASTFGAALRRTSDALRGRLEGKVGGCTPDALAPCSGLDEFQHIPRLDLPPLDAPPSAQGQSFDVKIRELAVDVFVKLGSGVLEGDILKAAKHGVWSFAHMDTGVEGNTTAGFWEVLHDLPITCSTLQLRRGGHDDRAVIGRSLSATCRVSVRRNRNSLHWKASLQIPWKLRELHLLGAERFFANVEGNGEAPAIDLRQRSATPRLFDEVLLVARTLWRIYTNRLRDLVVASQWILLFDFRDAPAPTPAGFARIVPPRDRFWADPHAVIRDGKHYAFIEEFLHSENKGCIAAMQINEDGTHTEPRRVLEEPYHLSHPCVFESGGQLFLIPESARNRTVDLYRCVSFPDRWERCETLLHDVHAVDATIHFHQGRWWLFTSIREHESGSGNEDLFLFFSDSLQRGRWTAHPRNPVVSDVTRARPAGNLFEHEGTLYRPAQDCSIRYGYGIRIQAIRKLSESDYHEEEVAFIRPDWDPAIVATHTLSRAGRLTLSDALEERWNVLGALRSDGHARQ